MVRSRKNSNPLESAHVPAPLLPMQAAADAAPADPSATAAPRRWRGRGSAPSPAERAGRLRGGRRPRAARREGRPHAARLAARQPGWTEKKAPPGRRCARGAWVRWPPKRPAMGIPLPKEPPMLHQQRKPLGIKHSRGEGLPRRRTH